MEIPLQVTFHEIDSSEAIEGVVHERTQKLGHYYDRIQSCRVVIEAPNRHSHKERKVFQVRIDVTVPGQELVVSNEPGEHQAHHDIHVAIRDAFTAMERQVKTYAQKRQRGTPKEQELPA